MPLLSMFTPCGALTLSSRPSRIQAMYEAYKNDLNDRPDENFSLLPGSNIEASVYARAREQARARYALDRAYNNANPLKATETLPQLEQEYELSPGPDDTVQQRRAALAARMLLPGGANYANVTTALSTLLGADFVAYRLTPSAEAVNFPSSGGASPGNFRVPQTVIKNYTLLSGVSFVGTPVGVNYQPFDATVPTQPILNGDVLVVDPNINGITESVTVTSATPFSFTATFANPHDPGVMATTQPYPFWESTKRYAMIVVSAAAAANQEARRKIHDLMGRIARGVSTWSIVPVGAGGHVAQFTIDDPVLGLTDYGAIDGPVYP